MDRSTETEKLIEALLSRRGLLQSAGGFIVAGGALALIGCGGNGGSSGGAGPSGGLTGVSGVVTIPPGSPISALKLSVDVLGGSTSVSGGKFKAKVAANSPCLALLNDPSGNGVMMSMLDPTLPSQTISANSTATAYIFFAIGAHLLPAAAMSHALALISAHSATTTLTTTLTGLLKKDAYALKNQSSTVATAVAAAAESVIGASSGARPQALTRTASGTPTLLLVSPTGQQTGVDVSQDASTSALIATNSYRRHCRVYLYETTTLTGNVTTDISPAKRKVGPIQLDSVEELNLFTAAKDFLTFFHGTSPWSPVSIPPIPIQLDGSTDRTTYTLVVIGSSFLPDVTEMEPPFFSDPHYVNEVATWRSDGFQLFIQTFMGDIFLPIVCMFGGFGAIVASQGTTALLSNSFNDYAANFRNIVNNVRAGKTNIAPSLVLCLEDAIQQSVTRENLSAELKMLLDSARAAALQQFTSAQFASRLSNALDLLNPIFAAGAVLTAGDIGATINETATAPFGDIWTALILKQSLHLSPLNPSASPGDRVTFTVAKPNDTADTYEYDWTQSSPYATLSASDAVGNKITTKQLTVDLVTTGSDSSPITVTVTGYDVTTGQRVEIGNAGTVVKMLLPASITPSSPQLNVGDKQVFSVEVGGKPPTGLQYKWTLTGTSGSIGDSPVTTKVPQITYTASENGTDTLQVQVLDSSGALVAKTGTSILVGPVKCTISFTIAGTWQRYGEPSDMPANGTYDFSDGIGARFKLTDPAAPPNSDGLDLSWDNLDNGDGSYTPGVGFTMVLSSGEQLVNGKAYPLSQLTPDAFVIFVQAPLSAPGSLVPIPKPTAASIVFTNLFQPATGKNTGNFIIEYSNDTGGLLQATGVAVWQFEAVGANVNHDGKVLTVRK